jgi:hypothetical protein
MLEKEIIRIFSFMKKTKQIDKYFNVPMSPCLKKIIRIFSFTKKKQIDKYFNVPMSP